MQNNSISVTATLGDAILVKDLVEELAARRKNKGYHHETTGSDWQAIEISSIEAYVSGDAILVEGQTIADMLFTTAFLFTCTRGKNDKYNLSWASSLS